MEERIATERSGKQQELATFVAAFFGELRRWGVQDVVVSPGSRSTPLTMAAQALGFNVVVDVDERGAAFLALGMAKAKQSPVAVVCTSGTALANYAPAVMEAESTRVPLLVLSGDRPARLQNVGAPQTFDQLHFFSTHVRGFWNAPEPSGDPRTLAYVRQLAREACVAMGAAGVPAGPAHVNFPFDEPLVPCWDTLEATREGATCESDARDLPPFCRAVPRLAPEEARGLAAWLDGHTPIVLCGEGTFSSGLAPAERDEEAAALLAFARRFGAPLVADPLSGLRSYGSDEIVDAADALFASGEVPPFDAVVRFGRYPVSKPLTSWLETHPCEQVVVDPFQTRDFNGATTTFVPSTPASFVQAVLDAAPGLEPGVDACRARLERWRQANRAFADAAARVSGNGDDGFEGSYVRALVEELPEGALLFSANSMSIRALDTFYAKSDKPIALLGNRGLNGIDGTISSAVGAALALGSGALLVGDLAFVHDVNALALQRELLLRASAGEAVPSLAVVVLNNNGGAIFDMLPQSAEERCFERLFLTPQDVDVQAAAQTFGVPHCVAPDVASFRERLADALGTPGLSVIEVRLPLRGVRERYAPYKQAR